MILIGEWQMRGPEDLFNLQKYQQINLLIFLFV